MSASQAIQSSYFENVKDLSKEQLPLNKFRLPVDKEAAFDYETGVSN